MLAILSVIRYQISVSGHSTLLSTCLLYMHFSSTSSAYSVILITNALISIDSLSHRYEYSDSTCELSVFLPSRDKCLVILFTVTTHCILIANLLSLTDLHVHVSYWNLVASDQFKNVALLSLFYCSASVYLLQYFISRLFCFSASKLHTFSEFILYLVTSTVH